MPRQAERRSTASKAKAKAKKERANKKHREKLADPEYAAARLAELRRRDVESTKRYLNNLKEQAETDPEAASKWEAHRAYNNRYSREYHAKHRAVAGDAIVTAVTALNIGMRNFIRS